MRNDKQDESDITEELIKEVLNLYEIGVRQQTISGILNIEFKILERIRDRLIKERKIN